MTSGCHNKKDLKHVKEAVTELKKRLSAKVMRQKKLNIAEKQDFRREELLEKYMAKILYEWNNRKFKEEYLKKLERKWKKWKSVSPEKKP